MQKLINLNDEEAQIYGASQGVLMPDVTLLPLPSRFLPPPAPPQQPQLPSTVCIEIKPKYGSITTCDTILPEDVELKHSTSRYQLHQLLKKDQGVITTVSSYDPVDLFSSVPDRMENALHSLLENPQNNLRIFINGKPVDSVDSVHTRGESVDSTGGGGGGGQREDCSLDTAIRTASAALLSPENQLINTTDIHLQKKSLVTLLRLILQQEPVLQNISRAQQACHMDIAGIYRLYHLMILEMNASEDKKAEEIGEKALSDGRSVPLGKESIETMRSYVIATTAKDCSIMITMRSNNDYKYALDYNTTNNSKKKIISAKLQTEKETGVVIFSEEEEEDEEKKGLHSVEYRVSVVDLDRKSTLKIPKHFKLDQEITTAAKKLREKQN